MRIGVISDTHGNTQVVQQVIALAGRVDWWLHAGDYSQDAQNLAEWSGAQVAVAAGNCDGRVATPRDVYVEIGGKKLWLTHGHRYGVKNDLEEMVWWGGQYGVHIAVFGHTHVPYCQWHGDLLLFNPGSLALPRFGRPTYGVLTIKEDMIAGEIIEM